MDLSNKCPFDFVLQVFATPEAQMGFHPDAGASYYLSRLPGYLGNASLNGFLLELFSMISQVFLRFVPSGIGILLHELS